MFKHKKGACMPMKKYLGAKVIVLAVLMVVTVSTLFFTGLEKPSGNAAKGQPNMTSAVTTPSDVTTTEPAVTEAPVTEE